MRVFKARCAGAFVVCAFIVLLSRGYAPAQSRVMYEISFENAVHHEAEISATFVGVAPGVFSVRMSRSSPGRYALHEFAKNVYNVRAFDGAGRPVTISRPDPYRWNISGHDGTVRVVYTLFADRADGTYSGVDGSHAHLNMPATFMWSKSEDSYPVEITFHLPTGSPWKIATQLYREPEQDTFSAPDMYYFMDSPVEASDFSMREWTEESGENPATFQLVVHDDGDDEELDSFWDMAKAVIREHKAVFGEFPDFDFGRYTFLACYRPYVSGDGMEHRNSTILTSTRSLRSGLIVHLGSLSHEFFHAWNVERLRPKSLEPFDFERANMSGALWFAEGFTSYYDDLAIRRAGFYSNEQYAALLSPTLTTVINAPGRTFFSPVGMSMQAPFVDAARSVDPTNRGNTFISYYTYGSAIALGLDLTLRTRYDLTLDNFMRDVWERFGRTEIPYTVGDLRDRLAAVTGDEGFAEEFFDKYVVGHDVVDYARLLERAGFLLRKKNPGAVWLGDTPLAFGGGNARLSAYTTIGSPLYNAGLDAGDTIVSIDGVRIAGRDAFTSILSSHSPGDRVPLFVIDRTGKQKTSRITFAEDNRLEVVPFENASRDVTDSMKTFRQEWLGSRVKK